MVDAYVSNELPVAFRPGVSDFRAGTGRVTFGPEGYVFDVTFDERYQAFDPQDQDFGIYLTSNKEGTEITPREIIWVPFGGITRSMADRIDIKKG